MRLVFIRRTYSEVSNLQIYPASLMMANWRIPHGNLILYFKVSNNPYIITLLGNLIKIYAAIAIAVPAIKR